MTYLTPQESLKSHNQRVQSYIETLKKEFRDELKERTLYRPQGGSFSFWFRDYYNMPQEQFELVLKELEPYGWYARITNIKMSRYSAAASLHYDISPTPFKAPEPNKFIQKIKAFFATYFCDP